MLDYYLINEEQSKPDYPEKADLKFVAGIDYKTYKRLVDKDIIDAQFEYYSDFRWSRQIIEQVYENIKEKPDSNVDKLKNILIYAINSENELIAFFD